jgi:hypothetical protein
MHQHLGRSAAHEVRTCIGQAYESLRWEINPGLAGICAEGFDGGLRGSTWGSRQTRMATSGWKRAGHLISNPGA